MSHSAIENALARRSWFIAFGLAVLSFTAPSSAQVLRDPPTPYGPLVYNDSFPDPAAAGVSSGLKDIPLLDEPDWYVNFGGSLRDLFELGI
jgi:hypothetical protein